MNILFKLGASAVLALLAVGVFGNIALPLAGYSSNIIASSSAPQANHSSPDILKAVFGGFLAGEAPVVTSLPRVGGSN